MKRGAPRAEEFLFSRVSIQERFLAPLGMCSTLKDQINAELLAFLQRSQQASA